MSFRGAGNCATSPHRAAPDNTPPPKKISTVLAAAYGDMTNVLAHHGSVATALRVHGLTATLMVVNGLLIMRETRTVAATPETLAPAAHPARIGP
ncbi:hypothetical protein ACOT81_28295 [Streptomyces sp. WI04-05B]|uniref:hypothetical protein n=1 Tax=Streptomyces TaxID=1883 RepID=UPI0029A24D2E|nr:MULTISPECIES: hypothetical protein [unclassified Streptomyces]MDX2544423.1 hypothetical protein [Streptomyces sp. WI04-05B]MDX2588508.1 hypothetical protein [Streptomyces sp. WI04-05A]MDX3750565.1 hypothetical protein [Streptomyces sp. AK08-02]